MLRINGDVMITVGGERLEVVGAKFMPIDIPNAERVAFIVSRGSFNLYAAAPELLAALEYCAANSADIDLDYIEGVINKAKGNKLRDCGD
jgi:hypothetical protein